VVSQSVALDQVFDEKERTFYVTLPGRPTRVDVDPEQAILGEIKENKSREWWVAQLTERRRCAAVRAQHFGRAAAADRRRWSSALTSEKFWGVQGELVRAGRVGRDVCRDALIANLKHTEARTRRACVEQLGKFHGDAKVAAAIKEVLRKGDALRRRGRCVEGLREVAAARRGQRPPAVAGEALAQRDAAPRPWGPGRTQDLSALDTLVTWTQRGKRATAARARSEH
jgi:hypothetical protein